jgi:hypothetical protein
MLDLLYAWVVGAVFLIGVAAVTLAIGYLVRQVSPVEKWNSPLETPSYEFDEMDIGASLIVGFVVILIIFVPLIFGAAVL